jgi:UTP--glucose-1-phosphate uridylyltransferase
MSTTQFAVRKAILPVAGLGTRMLPATKAIPKEMIPIIDIPMIQYVVEEAVRSGIEDIVLVTARHKEAIENHFDYNYELEDHLEKKSKKELAEISKSVAHLCNLISIRQKNPMGLGHAVLAAEPAIGNEPFAVLLGDDLIDGTPACTGQLIELFLKEQAAVVGVMNVFPDQVNKYGIIDGSRVADRTWKVKSLVEKPNVGEAPSTLAIPGRYILPPSIFKYLKDTKPGKGGEIQLTDALQKLAENELMFAYEFQGDRYDTGDRLGYLDATLTFGLRRPELRDGIIQLMQKHLKGIST